MNNIWILSDNCRCLFSFRFQNQRKNVFQLRNIEIRTRATVRKHTQITIQNTCFFSSSFRSCSLFSSLFFLFVVRFGSASFRVMCGIQTHTNPIDRPTDRPTEAHTYTHATPNTEEAAHRKQNTLSSVPFCTFPSSSLFFQPNVNMCIVVRYFSLYVYRQ